MAGLREDRLRRLCVVATVSAGLFGFSFLDEVARRVEQGNQLFDQAEFEAALEAYREAQTDRPESPELHYNVGDALYKQGAVDEAAAAFQKAVETGDPELGSKAYYNLGNALYRQQMFDQAIGAYENALELNPSDQDAKINLEMALEKLEEQQKQQNQDQNQDQENKENQNEENDSESKREQQDTGAEDQKNQEPQSPPKESQNQRQQKEGESQQPGELTPEQAERLLDALKDRETESQKRRRVRLQGKRYRGKPW